MEATSEKRGRPRIIPGLADRFIREQHPNVTTDRQRRSIFYANQAASMVCRDEDEWNGSLAWLLGERIRVSILAEMFLLHRDRGFTAEQLRSLAVELCERRPAVKTAVEWLRALRLDVGE